MTEFAHVELALEFADKPEEPPSREEVQQWVDLALINNKPSQVNIRVVDESESQSLNKEYRNKDSATNVLSFPMELPEELMVEMDMTVLGDLVVCAAVIEKEARQQGKKVRDHWAHIIVHGMLHLQGYDHISESDAEIMENLEIQLLKKIDIDNPYLETH